MTNGELAHEALTREIIGAAIEVHRYLGPGLLESSYQAALAHELTLRGHTVAREQKVAVRYKEIDLVGLLSNFNVPVLQKGLKGFVNGKPLTGGQNIRGISE